LHTKHFRVETHKYSSGYLQGKIKNLSKRRDAYLSVFVFFRRNGTLLRTEHVLCRGSPPLFDFLGKREDECKSKEGLPCLLPFTYRGKLVYCKILKQIHTVQWQHCIQHYKPWFDRVNINNFLFDFLKNQMRFLQKHFPKNDFIKTAIFLQINCKSLVNFAKHCKVPSMGT
jgi:hypothetical protein